MCFLHWQEGPLPSEPSGKPRSPVGQLIKNPLAMQETQVQFLGQEDPLEKEVATHSSIVAWKIPWTEEPGGLVYRIAESDTTAVT